MFKTMLTIALGVVFLALMPALAQDVSTPFPELAVISPDNVNRLELLKEIPNTDCFIDNVSISADNHYIATTGSGTVQVWDVKSGERIAQLGDFCDTELGGTNAVFSPVEPLLAYGTRDSDKQSHVTLWDAETHAARRTLDGVFVPLAFSPNGELLATIAGQSSPPCSYETAYSEGLFSDCEDVQVWEVATGALRVTVPGYTQFGNYAAFSPDNSLIIFSNNSELLAWDTTTGELADHFFPARASEDTNDIPNAVGDIATNRNTLCVIRRDEVFSYRFVGKKISDRQVIIPPNMLGDNLDSVQCLNDMIAIGGQTGIIGFVAPPDNINIQGKLLFFSQAHSDFVSDLGVSRDSKLLISVSHDDSIRVWGVPNGKDIQLMTPTISPSQTAQLADQSHGDVSQMPHFEPIAKENSKQVQQIGVLSAGDEYMNGLAFSPDGTLLAASGRRQVTLWDMTTQTIYRQIAINGDNVAFSPDGKRIAIWSISTSVPVTIWDVGTGQQLPELEYSFKPDPDDGNLSGDLAFSNNGQELSVALLYSITLPELIRWDLMTNKIITVEKGLNTTAVFSPDSKVLAYAVADLGWGLSNQQDEFHDNPANYIVDVLGFSPDGNMLILNYSSNNSESRTPYLLWWDVKKDVEKHRLNHQFGTIFTATFNPDGSILAVGAKDGKTYLIDNSLGESLAILGFHTQAITDLAFSPNGEMLATASFDGTVRLWAVSATGQGIGLTPSATPTATYTATATATPTITPTPQPEACRGAPVPRLVVGAQGRVLDDDPTPINMRSGAARSFDKVMQVPAGAIFDVISGPECADGYFWYEIDYQGTQGWVAEGDSTSYFTEPYN